MNERYTVPIQLLVSVGEDSTLHSPYPYNPAMILISHRDDLLPTMLF